MPTSQDIVRACAQSNKCSPRKREKKKSERGREEEKHKLSSSLFLVVYEICQDQCQSQNKTPLLSTQNEPRVKKKKKRRRELTLLWKDEIYLGTYYGGKDTKRRPHENTRKFFSQFSSSPPHFTPCGIFSKYLAISRTWGPNSILKRLKRCKFSS